MMIMEGLKWEFTYKGFSRSERGGTERALWPGSAGGAGGAMVGGEVAAFCNKRVRGWSCMLINCFWVWIRRWINMRSISKRGS